ncbi:MAG: HepT-like ribonuclease domain-containing protein [Pyrinomonadaceae bacterium]
MRDDRERLYDIIEAIDRIEKYAAKGRADFDEDELIQTWVLHHLQIIGEAVRALSTDTTSLSDDIEWQKIVGMRNILVHNYSASTPMLSGPLSKMTSKGLKQQFKTSSSNTQGRCHQL